MNIQVQCCGIILLLVLLFFYVRQKKLKLDTEKAFMLIFMVILLCMSLDILSVVVISHMEYVPEVIAVIVCKSYPASLVCVAMCCLRYVCVDVYSESPKYKLYLRLIACMMLVAVAIIYVLPIMYHYEPELNELYTYGPSITVTYIFSVATLVAIVAIMHFEKHRINAKRREAVQLWMLLWIGAAAIQAWDNNLLLIGFAGCVGIMTLYIKLENPETNLDRKTSLFNQNALNLYVRQLYARQQNFAMMSILFDGAFDNESSSVLNKTNLRMINFLLQVPESYAFKYSEDELILVFNNRDIAKEWAYKVKDYYVSEWDNNNPIMLFVPDAKLFDNGEDLFNILRYVRENHPEFAENILSIINEDIIADMYQEKNVKRQIINAIESDLVEVYYQPIYSTKEHRFMSAEALVRIKDENGKIIMPGLFIEVAEKNGMILKIGEIVFEKVCRFIKEHRIEQYGIEYVEVNLSVIQCADEHLAENFIRIMEKYQVSPNMINLEITESASLNAKKILLENMRTLINYGVTFSLDDFGTGQSNLNYIVDMPVDIVKFDRGMTNAYFENGKARYVMDAAMHMIQGMKLQIVSEGIETKKQFDTMESLGISYIQGYYFSRPLPEAEFVEFMVKNCEKTN